MKNIDQSYVREAFEYDMLTGVFTWKERPLHHFASSKSMKCFNTRYAGKQAGAIDVTRGYIMLSLKNQTIYAHRVAWLWVWGCQPRYEIDHMDGNRSNNALLNLRDVNRLVNSMNRCKASHNTSGVVGVSWAKNVQKWIAYIKVNKEQITLGYFTDKEDAVAARQQAQLQYGYSSTHGREAMVWVGRELKNPDEVTTTATG